MQARTYRRINVLMLIFGVMITCIFQTLNRLSWDGQTYSHHVRFLFGSMTVNLMYLIAVLWMWRVVFPEVCRALSMKRQVLLLFIPISLTEIVHDLLYTIDYTTTASKIPLATFYLVFWLILLVVLYVNVYACAYIVCMHTFIKLCMCSCVGVHTNYIQRPMHDLINELIFV